MSIKEALSNKGFHFIGDESAFQQEQKTIIVVGVARGGTSLVSGALSHLGVFTGQNSGAPVFEDIRLANAFENGTEEDVIAVINDYNNSHDVWSFKRPGAIKYLPEIHRLCRNPCYIFIFKDFFSIAKRNNISMKLDIFSGLKKAYSDYAYMIDFISENSINGLLFSYEKIMNDKIAFVDVMQTVVNDLSEEKKRSALGFIRVNPEDYLNASRITRTIGQVGTVTSDRVIGWCKYVSNDKPVKVDLYINEKIVASLLAEDYREGPHLKNVHPTGLCGYEFNLEAPLSDGDVISVKATDDVEFLKNSNQVYKA